MENNLDKINNDQLINKLNKDANNSVNHNIILSKEEKVNDKSNINISTTNNSIILNSLFKAVQENDINEIESNLIKDNSNINTLNSNGLSLLHLSVIKGNIQIVNKLLKYGANPNILSIPNKQTPLHLAYLSQESTKDNIISTLLSFNADENIIDLYDNKPSDYNKISNKKGLITPDKKNKPKKEDLYYKVNDININIFSTSDVKKKSTNKKEKNKDISKMPNKKCNCIFTPKKYSNNNNYESIKTDTNYNFSDLKNLDINFNSINSKKDNYININDNQNNQNINMSNNNILNNNESIKNINIYENINNDKDNNFNKNKNNNNIGQNEIIDKNNDLFISKENNNDKNIENNILNDSLEESKENKIFNKTYENFNNENLDELLKKIITNKRKSLAEISTSKKRNKSLLINNTNTFLKNNIFININNSNNSCTYTSTQNQTSQKKISIKNKENIINEKNKNISKFKYNPLIKSNIINKNINYLDDSGASDDIIQKINKNRKIFKNWLSSINLIDFYQNFIENEIYDINQLLNIVQNKQPKELLKFFKSILKTKKNGYIYRIICKIEIDLNLINPMLINFLAPDFKLKKNNNDNCNLSISGGKNVICGRKNKEKEEKNILKIFLNKNNLIKFYQNFEHNGFNFFEYVLIQMYSRIPINDFILENHFHIYESDDRKKVLDALIKETENVNKFINTEEYLTNKIKNGFKYENYILENKNDIHLIIKNDDKRCNLCVIY